MASRHLSGSTKKAEPGDMLLVVRELPSVFHKLITAIDWLLESLHAYPRAAMSPDSGDIFFSTQ